MVIIHVPIVTIQTNAPVYKLHRHFMVSGSLLSLLSPTSPTLPLLPHQGGFPFSTQDCGWIVADCTAEGLKSLMLLQELCPSIQPPVPPKRLYQAVNVVSNAERDLKDLRFKPFSS